MKYTTMDRIFSKLGRDLSTENINEVDIIEWTGEALEQINAIRAKEEAVAFITVSNYQCEIPSNLHNIIQIAKNTELGSTTTASSTETETLENETDYPVCLDCSGAPINDYSVAYYRPYYDLQYEYNLWRSTNSYNRCYVPVRLSNHSFFNSMVCSEDGTDCGSSTTNGLYIQSEFEYTIIEGEVLRFNFESGLIALAYLRNPQDKEGLPMIPDDISFTTAIVAYITFRMMSREFYAGRQGAQGRMNKAEEQWQWYCKQSSNKSLIPQGVDEMQNLVEQTNYIVPRRNAYQNYFGNLNNREVKNLLHTERRNNSNYGNRTYING